MKAQQDTGRKREMNVKLKHSTPLHICSDAIRTCWQSQDASDTQEAVDQYITDSILDSGFCGATDHIIGEKDKALIDRVGNKFKHASTLEHLSYNFEIDGISRACLQELARHRMASLSVKSTRYTLKELKAEESIDVNKIREPEFDLYNSPEWKIATRYLVSAECYLVDLASTKALCELQEILKEGISNDRAKYCLPESYKTSLAWTINARSLQNFLSLRSDKSALLEIQKLAHAVYDSLPIEHKYLFEDHIKNS